MSTITQFLNRLVSVKPKEISALLISCGYFYLILCAYYIIRPIRSEMAIANGVVNIPWLMVMTFMVLIAITPVFGWVTTRFRTQQFLAYCTLFFASHLVIFYFLFDVETRGIWVTRAFFVWVNVFNMFIVSLFWSFMNDVYSREQASRLFAFIAAGGTAGAISGPIITTFLVTQVGLAPLLLISSFLLCSSVLTVNWLTKWRNDEFSSEAITHTVKNRALKGSVWGGITLILRNPYLLGICLLIALYAISITFIEIQQATLIERNYSDPELRTRLFSSVDLAANVLALLLQLFVTAHMIQKWGFRATLLFVPLGITIGFGVMTALPILGVMVAVEVFRRSGDYAIMKPTREMLFSVVSREEKYKAKNFIDTTILRGGNMASAFAFSGVRALGVGAVGIAGISVFLGLAWCAVAFLLGSEYQRRRAGSESQDRSGV